MDPRIPLCCAATGWRNRRGTGIRGRPTCAAKQLIEDKKFEEGEKAFHAIEADKKCPEQFREEALFFEAECQRLEKKLRGAEETYALLFKDFPSTQFTERADRSLFEIALHWLEETRRQMEAYEEQREGKRMFVNWTNFVHFSEDMPVFDAEGHAVRVPRGRADAREGDAHGTG